MIISLVGNPNSGKTSLFNKLTGSNQSVGNWPGVTVEKKSGYIKGTKTEIIDLPGVYSLSSMSLEEEITRDYLVSKNSDLIINIIDASNIERSLYLTSQLIDLDIPIVVALNMVDILKRRKDVLDVKMLSEYYGIPFVEISVAKNYGIDNLVKSIEDAKVAKKHTSFPSYIEEAKSVLTPILTANNVPFADYTSTKILENDAWAIKQLDPQKYETIVKQAQSHTDEALDEVIVNARYEELETLIKKAYKPNKEYASLSTKIDKLVLNRFLALPIFFAIMWFIYYISISTVGDASIGWVETIVGAFGGLVTSGLEAINASPVIISLIIDGIIAGVGAVLTFVPQIMILYFFLTLLEDSGYMSRIAFMMDKIFMHLGLSGKSFIPMIIGTGCSVPGIMAVRTIENQRDRRLTAIMTPFVPCGAKMPVFALFIASFFPNSAFVATSLYFVAIVVIILSALLLKKVLFKGEVSPFILELPQYKLPQASSVARQVLDKAKAFIVRAGTVIFIGSTLIWFTQTFNWRLEMVDANDSILASLGQLLVPLFAPLGIDNWQLSVATLTGFVAKEQIVSTLAILFNTTESSLAGSLATMLEPAAAYGFMIFTLLASPCFAAIGALKSELNSTKWTVFALLYQTGIAYILAFLIYQIGSRL